MEGLSKNLREENEKETGDHFEIRTYHLINNKRIHILKILYFLFSGESDRLRKDNRHF